MTKYEKGSFVVIPNKNHLRGKSAEMQSIYFWICEHADENGVCFPTRKVLADEAGVGIRTLDKCLKNLVKDGFLTVIKRKKNNSKENTSNLYQIMVLEGGVVSKKTLPSVKKDTRGSVKKDTETVSNINSNHLSENLAVFNSLKKNKPLILQRLRVNFINHGILPIEEDIVDIYENLIEDCSKETPEELQSLLKMYGL